MKYTDRLGTYGSVICVPQQARMTAQKRTFEQKLTQYSAKTGFKGLKAACLIHLELKVDNLVGNLTVRAYLPDKSCAKLTQVRFGLDSFQVPFRYLQCKTHIFLVLSI